MTTNSSWDIGSSAANVLAPESGLLANPDVAEFSQALIRALRSAGRQPATARAILQLAAELSQVPPVTLARWLGAEVEPPFAVDPKDRRFADPAWQDNPAYYSLRLAYLALARFANGVVDGAEVDAVTQGKARLFTNLVLDAVAPTNFLPGNPAALKRAFDTGGRSLIKGTATFVDDLINNKGRPRQVDRRPFELGKNIAATKAKVVYRNDLMELLQYEPQTDRVRSSPLLLSPPWINKYYVMDLAPGRSFVEWAVQHDRTVFAISYRNPGDEMSGVTLDDYLIQGPRQALDVVQEITGAETIDMVGLCLGGALTAITDAFLTQVGDSRVGTLTLLNTMLDYSNPGALGMFTDEATVARLERQMQRKGHLPGASMAGTFDVLRPNDLIFNYVVANWLMGQDPPAFDILSWNADSTKMPAAMHSFYLRNFYVQNKLALGELEIAGRQIDLADIKKSTYIVSAENDHIVPWTAAYAGARLLSGPVRFVLSSGGHIAGIVNPPGPKGWYLTSDDSAGTGDELPPGAPEWRAGTVKHTGSWWVDWAAWSSESSGDLVDPPRIGSEEHPVLGDGPGDYVRA